MVWSVGERKQPCEPLTAVTSRGYAVVGVGVKLRSVSVETSVATVTIFVISFSMKEMFPEAFWLMVGTFS